MIYVYINMIVQNYNIGAIKSNHPGICYDHLDCNAVHNTYTIYKWSSQTPFDCTAIFSSNILKLPSCVSLSLIHHIPHSLDLLNLWDTLSMNTLSSAAVAVDILVYTGKAYIKHKTLPSNHSKNSTCVHISGAYSRFTELYMPGDTDFFTFCSRYFFQ